MIRVVTHSTLVVVLIATVCAVVTSAARATSIPVRVTISDTQDTYPLRVQSDTQGEYVQTKQIQSSIERFTSGLTDWMLTTYTSRLVPTNRRVFFDLSEPMSADNPVPPFSAAWVPAHLTAKCSHVNVDMLRIPAGATALCPGTFRFQAPNGFWYRLAFNPANYPEVERLSVTCTGSDSSGCLSWSIAPSGTTRTWSDPNPKNLTRLIQIDASGSNVLADLGNYYVSFFITVTR